MIDIASSDTDKDLIADKLISGAGVFATAVVVGLLFVPAISAMDLIGLSAKGLIAEIDSSAKDFSIVGIVPTTCSDCVRLLMSLGVCLLGGSLNVNVIINSSPRKRLIGLSSLHQDVAELLRSRPSLVRSVLGRLK